MRLSHFMHVAIAITAVCALAGASRNDQRAYADASDRSAILPATSVSQSVYRVHLKPCSTKTDNNRFHVGFALGVLKAGARKAMSFRLPRLPGIEAWLIGKRVAWSVRTPSGAVIVPGHCCAECQYELIQDGIASLSIKDPEPGPWTVMAQSSGADTTTYAVDIWPDGPTEESPHLEMLLGDADPRPSLAARPGDVVFIRTFITRRGKLIAHTRWKVRALTPRDSLIAIPVFDDGHHADGLAGDGVFVGTLRVTNRDGLYRVRAEARAPGGIEYLVTETIDVEAKNDLLLADSILVSPEMPIAGAPVAVTVTAINSGVVEFRRVELELFVDMVKVSSQLLDLKAGEARQVVTTWVPQRSKDVTLQLTLNAYDEVGDLTNNTRRRAIHVR
jgi:hypothetical protein